MKKLISLFLILIAAISSESFQQKIFAEPQVQGNQSGNTPFGWSGIKDFQVIFSKNIKANGTDYILVFTGSDRASVSKKQVDDVYVIKKGTGCSKDAAFPPYVVKLIYHNLGPNKEFCGVLVKEEIRKSDGTFTRMMEREIKLDDDDANLIIKLLANTSEWTNSTHIELVETTSPNLTYPKVIN